MTPIAGQSSLSGRVTSICLGAFTVPASQVIRGRDRVPRCKLPLRLCDRAYGFAEELEPFEALAAWLRSFVGYSVSKKTLAGELTEALGKDSEFFHACKLNVREAGDLLLEKAKQAGTVRPELDLMDILRLVGGITMGRDIDPGQAERLLDIVLAGLKPVPAKSDR